MTCTDCGGSGIRWMGVGGPPVRKCVRCGGTGRAADHTERNDDA